MELEDAVGIITQVLSVIDRTPISYESGCPALKNALNRTRTLGGNPQPSSSPTRMSSHDPTALHAQNFRIILR